MSYNSSLDTSPDNDEVILDKYSNSSEQYDVTKDEFNFINAHHFPIFSSYVLMSYLICVNGFGVVLNLFIIWNLVKKKLTGFYLLVLQMAITDIVLLTVVSIPEIWFYNQGTWTMGSKTCALYLGSEVFGETSNAYFLITISLHAIATENLIKRLSQKKKDHEEELLQDPTELKSSRHSLVSRSRSENLTTKRTATLEHKQMIKIPVLIPILLVWVLATSLSIPEYTLSNIISKNSETFCTLVEASYIFGVRIVLLVLQLCIPLVVLVISGCVMACKLYRLKTKSDKNHHESQYGVLKLSLFLVCLYLILNVPRSLLSVYYVFKNDHKNSSEINEEGYSITRFNGNFQECLISISFSFAHYLSCVFKPMAYFYFYRDARKSLVRAFMKIWKPRENY